jgi:HSP20 family protein
MSQVLPERRPNGATERSHPTSELDQTAERVQRMLDQTFGRFVWPTFLSDASGWVPLVDIEEQDDAYVVEAELPGVKREDVNIEFIGNELVITGELKETERKGIVRRRTRRTGRFDYRVTLPDAIDSAKIEAKLTDGVLRIHVPKAEKAKRQRIEVKA